MYRNIGLMAVMAAFDDGEKKKTNVFCIQQPVARSTMQACVDYLHDAARSIRKRSLQATPESYFNGELKLHCVRPYLGIFHALSLIESQPLLRVLLLEACQTGVIRHFPSTCVCWHFTEKKNKKRRKKTDTPLEYSTTHKCQSFL